MNINAFFFQTPYKMEKFTNLPDTTIDFKLPDTTAQPQLQPHTQDEPFEELLEKLKLKDQILRYNISFSKYLSAYNEKICDMDTLGLGDLKKLNREIQIAVSSRTSGNMARRNYTGLLTTVEYVAPILGMNFKGLADVLAQSDEINEVIEELNIKYDVMHYIPPEVRLVYLTLNTALAINRENQKITKIANLMEEPVAQEQIDLFEDL